MFSAAPHSWQVSVFCGDSNCKVVLVPVVILLLAAVLLMVMVVVILLTGDCVVQIVNPPETSCVSEGFLLFLLFLI